MKKVYFTDHSQRYLREGSRPRTGLSKRDIEDILINYKYIYLGSKERPYRKVSFFLTYDFVARIPIVIIIERISNNDLMVRSIWKSNFKLPRGVKVISEELFQQAKNLTTPPQAKK